MFYLDMASGVPVYLQIAAGIRAERLSGRYRTGDRIPPVRELALALRVNPNTVAKAYRYLQEEGFLESRPGEEITLLRFRRRQIMRNVRRIFRNCWIPCCAKPTHCRFRVPAWKLF